MTGAREFNFDGLVGPSHNYAGLSRGNLASDRHRGKVSNPRAAAEQGLAKMAFLHALGVGQAVLPPQPRPCVAALRRCGFVGSDAEVLAKAARTAPDLLCRVSSASAMWTANAATVAPSRDTVDGRVHFLPANLEHMFHRSLEPETTRRVLAAIFADTDRFQVHAPLPPHPDFGDEGAANHTRLHSEAGVVHLFCWGRSEAGTAPVRYPARQTEAASQAAARLLQLQAAVALTAQQDPTGIDGGAFHSDVLMVGNGALLLLHERALLDRASVLATVAARLGPSFRAVVASEAELPLADAVAAYPFNSQLVTLPDGSMRVIAPNESREQPNAHRFLERVVAEDNAVTGVDYIDVRQSMSNGGGPACLRLRVVLEAEERAAIAANVFFEAALERALADWIAKHYRDRLAFHDLQDPALLDECHTALDELTQLLGLGSVYAFQR